MLTCRIAAVSLAALVTTCAAMADKEPSEATNAAAERSAAVSQAQASLAPASVTGCGPECDFCWLDTEFENNCPEDWYGTGNGCDCGCQWVDPDCDTSPIGACCSPIQGTQCIDGLDYLDCWDFGGAYLEGVPCAETDCIRCPGCDRCWTATMYEGGCPAEWEGNGPCDCGCQFEDTEDCEGSWSAGACCSAYQGECVDGLTFQECLTMEYGAYFEGQTCAETDCVRCAPECYFCWEGTVMEGACPPAWEGNGLCDCGCQFEDTLDCFGPPPTGACCIPLQGGECIDHLTFDDCWNMGYAFADGLTCAETDCVRCGPECDWCWTGTISEGDCDPSWADDGDCDCGCQWVDPDCPGGACCRGDTGACRVTVEADCTGPGETYWGDGTSCSPNPCPQPLPTGACCDSSAACTVSTEAECAGVYQGDGTNCTTTLCPPPTGACCYVAGVCSITTEVGCLGTYWGDGTDCSPNPCPGPTGACCAITGECTISTKAECDGTYWGNWTDCSPNPCARTGACCDGTACTISTQADCRGDYLGDATVCTPNPCAYWYRDADGDGHGDLNQAVRAAQRPAGYVEASDDCDDANPDIYPGAVENCNELDDDCDGQVDEGACDSERAAPGACAPASALLLTATLIGLARGRRRR